MNRQEKEHVVQLVKERFAQNPASFVVGYKGLTVDQMQNLRSKLREQGAALKVTKARLMKIALGDQGLVPHLKDQIGLVFGQEAPTVAKVLRDFAKAHEALRLIAGQFESDVLDKDGIIRMASLPSRPELLAKLCGTLQGPLSGFVFVLKMQLIRLVMVLKQIEQNKN